MKKITPDQLDVTSAKDSVLLYPTETVYGLGCSIYDTKAIEKIYLIKGRQIDKKVITLVDSIEQAKSLAEITDKEQILLSAGLPLTILLNPKTNAPLYLISKNNLISVRKTTHPICLKLIQKLGAPLVSTSANISGEPAVTNLDKLPQTLVDACDIVIDAGPLPQTVPSTIVQIANKEVLILRAGAVSKEQIEQIIREDDYTPSTNPTTAL